MTMTFILFKLLHNIKKGLLKFYLEVLAGFPLKNTTKQHRYLNAYLKIFSKIKMFYKSNNTLVN